MTKLTKRIIHNTINMSDGVFGISLHLWKFMPKNVNSESMLVEVVDKKGIVLNKHILLPHQLYLEDLLEISKNGEYDVFVTPLFPEQKRIPIFVGEEKNDTNN